MKKIVIAVTFLIGFSSFAQNLQVHYDFDRECVTTTVEMFKPDKLGNTFFFIDMNYGESVKGVSLAYWEIARVFKTKSMPVGINVEYNGGFGRKNIGTETIPVTIAYRINDAWLVGPVWSKNAKDFSKGVTLKALYKNIRGLDDSHSFQLTAVWYLHFLDKKMTFKGFADYWKQDSDFNFDGTADAGYIFLAEPQIWYHINKSFDLGGEVEFSNNFALTEGFKTRPTLAVKWNF